MAKEKDQSARDYGAELGVGIKEGMKGLNTTCSPKSRKTCIKLIVIPLALFIVLFAIGMVSGVDQIMYIGILFGFCLGIYQFYVGKFKMGLIYTITLGGVIIGCLIDLFKLAVTHTFKDSNGYPLIY